MSDIILRNISHSYDTTEVLKDIDITIHKGEFFTLLGPSGCGKTTLLRILAGFIQPKKGNVLIGETDITNLPPEKRNMGIVFQNYALFPNMTVRENIAYGLKIRKISKETIKEKSDYYMELSGLKELENRKINELSGGQQQRVAIARALVIEPQMLLLDEPMSNLDVALRVKMREEIREIQQKTGITTLFITHDQQEALAISDKIAVMNKGHVLQTGSPREIYDSPNQEFVANFVGTSNRFSTKECTVLGISMPKGQDVCFIRPERMCLSKECHGIPVTVTESRFVGVYCEYSVKAEAEEYRVIEMNMGDSDRQWKIGENVYLEMKKKDGMINA